MHSQFSSQTLCDALAPCVQSCRCRKVIKGLLRYHPTPLKVGRFLSKSIAEVP